MPGRLEGKVAIVTGAGGGIGRAVALRFAEEGARVVVAEIDAAAGAAVAAEIGDAALAVPCDVADAAQVDAMVRACHERFGPVDVLVNNAALVLPAVRHFLEVDEALWDRVLDVNLKGAFLCGRRVVDDMVERGAGVIINMSSGGATRAHRAMPTYDAAKGGIEGLTRAMALDLAPYGVRVVAIVPGLIRLDSDEDGSPRLAAVAATVPLGRPGTGADVAATAAFLASDDAAYITASTVSVDGGLLYQQRSPQIESYPHERFPRRGRLA